MTSLIWCVIEVGKTMAVKIHAESVLFYDPEDCGKSMSIPRWVLKRVGVELAIREET